MGRRSASAPRAGFKKASSTGKRKRYGCGGKLSK